MLLSQYGQDADIFTTTQQNTIQYKSPRCGERLVQSRKTTRSAEICTLRGSDITGPVALPDPIYQQTSTIQDSETGHKIVNGGALFTTHQTTLKRPSGRVRLTLGERPETGSGSHHGYKASDIMRGMKADRTTDKDGSPYLAIGVFCLPHSL